MKLLLTLSISASILLGSCSSNNTKKTAKPIENFKVELGQVAQKSVFKSDDKSIWGGSIVKGDDNLYHMFYSRWDKALGWAWVTHSEIAHAVSKSPFGPFKHKDIALGIRDATLWDGLCTHNPTVHKYGETYYLYYMGNTGDGKVYGAPGDIKLNPTHRNNQRIGVAVAASPNGPWKRFDKPLIDVSEDENAIDALMTSNPSIAQRPDGGYLLVYKAVGKQRKGIWGGPVVHCVATSDSPTGPFVKYDKPIFLAEGHDFPAEDPFIWYQDGKYRAILKDMHGAFTDAGQALVLFESNDGFDWKLAKNPLVSKLQIKWEDGTIQKVDHLERPQVFIENGKPKVLVCASDTKDANGVLHSFNVQIPITAKK